MNEQKPEKRSHSEVLEVHSIFRTIQGEGPFCGTPAVFIRLAGCNLQCPGCDTDYTSSRHQATAEEIVDKVRELQQDNGLVVITGGEPFRQEIGSLLRRLNVWNYYVQIETNGTLPPCDAFFTTAIDMRAGNYIVCSPKTGSIHKEILKNACALKYVLSHHAVNLADGLPIKALGHPVDEYVARPPKSWIFSVYVQPEDSKDERINYLNLQACINSCMKFGYTLQLQIHKLIGME